MSTHETYMYRCLQLAALAAGNTAPNPMVGAVLVYNNLIIGEGYHQQYGHAHAEVNCIASVSKKNEKFICQSTLYVSLEPCVHFGKTPPCANLIIQKNIPAVVIACRDSYQKVDGKGIEKLLRAGVAVTVGILEKEALQLNKRFFTFYTKQRPYIILKWAQSIDAKIAAADFSAVKISHQLTNRLVHKWRSHEAAIMIGTNTALHDNPSLTNRLWHGNNPVRVIIDRQLKLPQSLHVFDGVVKTIVFNQKKNAEQNGIIFYQVAHWQNVVFEITSALYQLNIQSVLVEGGARLLQSFIGAGYWDEARVITNEQLTIGSGVNAPEIKKNMLVSQHQIATDLISIYQNKIQL